MTPPNPTPARSADAAIIARVIKPAGAPLPDAAAEAVLGLFQLDRRDQARLHDLLVANQLGSLSPAEEDELESYLRVSLMIDLMHAKARSSLKPPA